MDQVPHVYSVALCTLSSSPLRMGGRIDSPSSANNETEAILLTGVCGELGRNRTGMKMNLTLSSRCLLCGDHGVGVLRNG